MGSILMEPYDVASYASIHNLNPNASICLSFGNVNPRGVFRDANLLSYSIPLVLAQLSLASIVNLFMTRLLRPLGLPNIVIQILGGLLLGPSFLGRIQGFTKFIFPLESFVMLDTLSSFAYMFYFFLIGVQLDPWILTKIRRKEITIGVSTVFSSMIFSMLGALILSSETLISLNPEIALSLPIIATSSSTISFPMIAQYLTEVKMVNSKFGRVALASSLVGNFLAIWILKLLMVSHETDGMSRILEATARVSLFLVIVAFVFRPMIMWVLERSVEGEELKQGFISIVILGALVSVFICKVMGIEMLFGPLIYGMAIPAGPPLGSALMEKMDLIISRMLMPLYFVKNGLVIDVLSITFMDYFTMQVVIVLAWFGKFFGGLLSSLYFRMPIREATQIGLVMNVQGILELGLFKILKAQKILDEQTFTVLCISIMIIVSIITPIQRYLYNPLRKLASSRRRTLMNLTPYSELRMITCVHSQEHVPNIINFIHNLHPTELIPFNISLIHLVELVGRAHPILISHEKSNKISPDSKSIVNAFQQLKKKHPTVLELHSFTAISPYSSMPNEVCEMAADIRASLIIIPFHKRLSSTELAGSSNPGIKMVNAKILDMSPCTVTIIVDRSPNISIPNMISCQLHRIAVFFIGGQDDREALIIGAKMASQPHIYVTLIRIFDNRDDVTKNDLDSEVVDSVVTEMAENPRFRYLHEVVEDGTGTVNLIRVIEDQYDLIILGRNHDISSPVMKGLSDWENSELGTLGDMFALPESKSKSTIVVVQQPSNPAIDEPGPVMVQPDQNMDEGSNTPLRRSFA